MDTRTKERNLFAPSGNDDQPLDLLDQVEDLRDRLRNMARNIRNCLNCMEGWHSYTQEFDKKPYYYSRKCECRIAWEKTRGELERKAFEYKRVAKEEYPDLITSEMLNWHHPLPKEEDIVPIEKIREINNRAEKGPKWSLPGEGGESGF